MSWRHLIMLLALSAIWGSTFMFIKVAVQDLAPATVTAARLVLAAAILALVLPSRMRIVDAVTVSRAKLRPLVVTALGTTILPAWLLAWGETRVESGLAALLQASAPLFTALLAFWFVHSERIGGLRLVGVVVGFAGVALAVGATPSGSFLGALAVVASGLCSAAGALYAARQLALVPVPMTALATTLGGALLLLPIGLAQLPSSMPHWKVIGSVAISGLGLSLAYLLYFALLARVGASRVIFVMYLVPPMALFYGVTILNEPLKASAVGGLALILGGVTLGAGLRAGSSSPPTTRLPS